VVVGFAVFFLVVKPYNAFRERTRRAPDPDADVRPCTECLGDIPKEARRCAFCASEQTPVPARGRDPEPGYCCVAK
jgi:large conductance mechanosensitive channel